MVQSTERYNSINNIHVIGPKGTGKTTALKKLEKDLGNAQYVDLAERGATLDRRKKFILMDNAQRFTDELSFQGIRDKIIIAAFSPGVLVNRGGHAF